MTLVLSSASPFIVCQAVKIKKLINFAVKYLIICILLAVSLSTVGLSILKFWTHYTYIQEHIN